MGSLGVYLYRMHTIFLNLILNSIYHKQFKDALWLAVGTTYFYFKKKKTSDKLYKQQRLRVNRAHHTSSSLHKIFLWENANTLQTQHMCSLYIHSSIRKWKNKKKLLMLIKSYFLLCARLNFTRNLIFILEIFELFFYSVYSTKVHIVSGWL